MPGPIPRLVGRLRTKQADHVVHGAKTLIAALLTWGIVAPWSTGGRPYMAVATALLMVNASTVYQSVTKAAQNVVARVAGLVLALAAAQLLGPTAGAVAVIAVLAGPRRTAEDRLQIASTAVIALAATTAGPMGSLVSPALQTLTGAAVGIAVNALVLPPLYLNESDSAVRDLARSMGTLLHDMGTGLSRRQLTSNAHTWLHQARSLDDRLTRAEEQVRQANESLRWNTRCVAHTRRKETASTTTTRSGPCAACRSRYAESHGPSPTTRTTTTPITTWGTSSSTSTPKPSSWQEQPSGHSPNPPRRPAHRTHPLANACAERSTAHWPGTTP